MITLNLFHTIRDNQRKILHFNRKKNTFRKNTFNEVIMLFSRFYQLKMQQIFTQRYVNSNEYKFE
jgi:hypothetical protein